MTRKRLRNWLKELKNPQIELWKAKAKWLKEIIKKKQDEIPLPARCHSTQYNIKYFTYFKSNATFISLYWHKAELKEFKPKKRTPAKCCPMSALSLTRRTFIANLLKLHNYATLDIESKFHAALKTIIYNIYFYSTYNVKLACVYFSIRPVALHNFQFVRMLSKRVMYLLCIFIILLHSSQVARLSHVFPMQKELAYQPNDDKFSLALRYGKCSVLSSQNRTTELLWK